MEKAIVLLSGGIDSAVAFWWAREQGWAPYPVTINYHRRPSREIAAVDTLCARLTGAAPLRTVELPFLREVDDLRETGIADALSDVPGTYVPARNLIFYSIAAHYAEVEGAPWIVGGHNGGDAQLFPDAAPSFFESLNALLAQGLLSAPTVPIAIVNPLHGLSKAEVLQQGVSLGVPLEVTWSCSLDGEEPCGTCHSCRERHEAFLEAGLADPLSVTVPPEAP